MLTIDTSHPSPNRSDRLGHAVSMLVLHATVGSYISSLDWLTNPRSRVSSHYLIRKDGYIAQLVDDSDAAWHAGQSSWQGLNSDAIQRCSIGVELENANDGHDPYPPAQVSAVTELCYDLVHRYAIPHDLVTRHLDIATPRGRKTDPAGFPWPTFLGALYTPAPVVGHYRVRAGAGVNVRVSPNKTSKITQVLINGARYDGTKVPGQNVTLKPFGTSNVWIKGTHGYVWSLLLEAL